MKDVAILAQGTFGAGCRGWLKAQGSLRVESRENEVHLNVVGYCVVVVTHNIVVLCVLAVSLFRHEQCGRLGATSGTVSGEVWKISLVLVVSS